MVSPPVEISTKAQYITGIEMYTIISQIFENDLLNIVDLLALTLTNPAKRGQNVIHETRVHENLGGGNGCFLFSQEERKIDKTT
jgi:hypothetical protein